MAGGFGTKQLPKGKFSPKKNNSEILKEFSSDSSVSKPKLFGTLFPGQSIHPNQESTKKPDINWSREFSVSKSVTQEQVVFVNQHTQEIKQAISELRQEIKKLTLSTDNLNQEIIQAVEQNIPEVNEYQLSFIQKIRNIIIEFRQNIDESSIWLQSFNRKKSRKNAFWNKAKDKKSGGEQYLFSSEHTASRSAN